MNSKLKWLRDNINQKDMQGFIITNPVNIKYLTNIDAEGILLITRKENIFITDGRYIEHARQILTIDDEIIVMNFKDIALEDYENFFLFCENVGFEENYMTYADYKEYKQKYKINNFEETEYIIEKQRMIKDEEEINNIKEACRITDKCFDYLKSYIKIGMTEIEIAEEIEKFFKANDAESLAFDTIVASGSNSSMPHAVPTNRRIQKGDPITIDMGCKYNGYCSDMTRTVFAKEIPDNIREIYDIVYKNQINVGEELKEGESIKNICRHLEGNFKLYGHDLIHSLGHGVGLDIHEMPFINHNNDNNLKENMVITNEPGIYIPGQFGVRIEDTVLITKYGSINLTKSDKNYIIVG